MSAPPDTGERPARPGLPPHVETVAQCAERVAHDLNNHLMVINSYAEILLSSGEFLGEAAESLRKIYLAGESAVKLIRQLSPASLGPAPPTENKLAPPAPTASDSPVVLLVEDDESMRALAILILQKHGCRVLEAASAAEALEVWKRHDARIRVLITDIVMPGDLTGRDLAAQLRTFRPGLRVIYTTGYGGDLRRDQTTTLLQKPYRPSQLVAALRTALAEPVEKAIEV